MSAAVALPGQCPTIVCSANHDRGSLKFNMINPETGNRIKMVTLDAETDRELSRKDLVKGYEYKKGSYLLLTEEDFDSARVESSSTMKVDKFVDVKSIDPVYFDASYYMGPDGDAGMDVYEVLREAIAKTGKMALARVVISRRERAIGIMPMGKGLVAHTLHEERDLNSPADVFDKLPDMKVDPEMVQLATQLIERQSGKYDPADFEDRYEARMRELIDAKLKGVGFEVEEEDQSDRGNVIDLMGALRRSLGQSEDAAAPAKKAAPPAKAAPKKAKKELASEEQRRQTALKLPIEGGKKAPAKAVAERKAAPSGRVPSRKSA
jgi:DNA end-binding protein Ku